MITPELVRECLNYEPGTGVFRWKMSIGGRARAGAIAGHTQRSGYCEIRLRNRIFCSHRLAWFYVHGRWPHDQIDHINGDPSDNRLANLREASVAENSRNTRPRVAGKLKGITFHKQAGKWQAQIKKENQSFYLGLFATAEDAHAAYAMKAVELFGNFARSA